MSFQRRFFLAALTAALLICGAAALADAVLALPAGLQVIEEEAFYGDTSFTQVSLPQGVREIRARAFAHTGLTAVSLPDSLTFIADDAFDGPEKVRVTVQPDTYAYSWAARLGYLMTAPTQTASKGGRNSVTVNWQAVDDAAEYRIYYGTSENIADASEITGVEGTSRTVTGLESGTVYYTWVKAVSGDRISAASNVRSVITLPDAPTLEEPVVSGNSIALSWNEVPGAAVYQVYYSTVPDVSTADKIDAIEETACTLSGLEYGTTYYIWMASINSSGGLRTTIARSVTTGPDPFIPVQAAPTGYINQITVSWNAVEEAVSYNVYYGTADDLAAAVEITGIEETSYVITGLDAGTTYYTWVRAVSADRVSSASEVKSVITYSDAPTLKTLTASGNSLSMSWNAVTGALLYRIRYNAVDDYSTATLIDNIRTTSCTIEGLEYNTKYYIWISSTNHSGGQMKKYSKTTEVDTFAPVQNKPTGLINQVAVSWEAVDGAASYNVYYSTQDDPASAAEITGIEGTDCTIEGLLAGTTYYTWVKAVGPERVSAVSNTEHVITYPDAPTLKTLTASGNSLSMTWNAVPGASVYRIRYNTTEDYSSATLIVIDDVSTTAYTIEDLEYGTKYYIWIASANTSGGQRKRYSKTTDPAPGASAP